jgi:glycosyltransferase involved in cell wall biosynthesis
MKILFVGETNVGSRAPQRVQSLRDLGHEVTVVSASPPGWSYESRPAFVDRLFHAWRLPLDRAGAGRAMASVASSHQVLVLDNARAIRPGALRAVRRIAPKIRIIWYSEDDMLNPVHRSRWIERSLGLFDLCVTTKSFNARPEELPALGARKVLFVNNTYCPHAHRPIRLDSDEMARWGSAASFVGTFEEPRAESMLQLARAGIPVRIWGNGWAGVRSIHSLMTVENRPAYGDDYRRVVAASAINLCFLRHGNRDRQTCRSVEIPAMGGFMVHEFSDEMTALFASDREAVYFRDAEELVRACRAWLPDEPRRESVAAAGYRRAVEGGFSHGERWRLILDRAMEET